MKLILYLVISSISTLVISLLILVIVHPFISHLFAGAKPNEGFLFPRGGLIIMFILLRILPLLPLWILAYFFIYYLKLSTKINLITIATVIISIYFLYGYFIFGDEFWRNKCIFENPNCSFQRIIKSEHRDFHFSLSSLLSTILFVILSFIGIKRDKFPGEVIIDNS